MAFPSGLESKIINRWNELNIAFVFDYEGESVS